MRKWIEVAEKVYPGVYFEQPADLYIQLARDVVKQSVSVSINTPEELGDVIDTGVMYRAIRDAQDHMAYNLGYHAIMQDFVIGQHSELDGLVAKLDNLTQEGTE